ncbi:hypothetical protein HETIRDRAFT_115651 [Heterobasidion irregulare TC 32-1]|uniref:Uncharacterized protein n=1 Tax=Heterobasidion irregulare (strain TC 32-1) TaxID=747525 RepID=W4KAE6_HETIT|nr:uncharacterized protein HETIRDRAFT_115651 [Heterobasidion irregulare TC 32-1]ETW82061.1 hypothetical protein HETIRDRAFT_115651 [Heterobasidion irregulare TC 32-1]
MQYSSLVMTLRPVMPVIECRLYILQARPLGMTKEGRACWLMIHALEGDVKVQQGMMVSVQCGQDILQGEVGQVLVKTDVWVVFEVALCDGQMWQLNAPAVWASTGFPEAKPYWASEPVMLSSANGST